MIGCMRFANFIYSIRQTRHYRPMAKRYGFAEEEPDFIINYDIKYRMGDKLNDAE